MISPWSSPVILPRHPFRTSEAVQEDWLNREFSERFTGFGKPPAMGKPGGFTIPAFMASNMWVWGSKLGQCSTWEGLIPPINMGEFFFFFFLLGLPWFATVYPNLKRWPKHVTNMYKKSVVPKVLNFDLHLLEGKPNHIWRIWGKNGRTWENYNICCRWENYVQEWDIYGLL